MGPCDLRRVSESPIVLITVISLILFRGLTVIAAAKVAYGPIGLRTPLPALTNLAPPPRPFRAL
jgi:hypothetical protein